MLYLMHQINFMKEEFLHLKESLQYLGCMVFHVGFLVAVQVV
jgi:hypothetical protein